MDSFKNGIITFVLDNILITKKEYEFCDNHTDKEDNHHLENPNHEDKNKNNLVNNNIKNDQTTNKIYDNDKKIIIFLKFLVFDEN